MMTAHKHNKSGWTVMTLVLSASLSACAVWAPPSGSDAVSAPVSHVQVVPMGSIADEPSPPIGAQDIQGLAALQLRIEDFPLAGGDRQRWQFELAAVEDLMRRGQLARARLRLAQLEQDVQQVSQRYFHHHGQVYLQRARQFSYLSSEQAGRLRAIEVAAAQGREQAVYRQARALVHELWSASEHYTVVRGDTLAGIAARPQVYDNGLLWPLITAANKGYFYRSNRLQAGWQLRYPLHPTLHEIFAVVERRP